MKHFKGELNDINIINMCYHVLFLSMVTCLWVTLYAIITNNNIANESWINW